VYSVLKHHAYANGTLYYHGPDPFLFFLSRLLSLPSLPSDIYDRFIHLFTTRVREQFGMPGDALALSMRILAAATIDSGLCDEDGVRGDYEKLLEMQEEDGSWPIGWFYKYGSMDLLIGNKGLTTAMAVRAIDTARRNRYKGRGVNA
jgi:hypothetical protein